MRIAVLSDTHAPRFWKSCPPRVADRLRGAISRPGDDPFPSTYRAPATTPKRVAQVVKSWIGQEA